jgi:hypothetical protein
MVSSREKSSCHHRNTFPALLNAWCNITGNLLIGPFELEDCLADEHY